MTCLTSSQIKMRRSHYIGHLPEIISPTSVITPNLYLRTGLIKLAPDQFDGYALQRNYSAVRTGFL
jgi:hypothetical protein